MLLKSLSLKNIRSYDSLEISFKPGSSLLSGDIGAGKTSILLSVEFALFGIMRGTISGGTLLRHGKSDGAVQLVFEVDGKNVKIGRTLKKSSNGIVQDAGFIEINGERIDGTAVELKSKILELLGYPDELVSKSKSMIFRYTVYTPQEEMKQIIYESSEERLEKLRKIFDMDKYKRIKENSLNYARILRSEMKVDNLFVAGILKLKEELKEINVFLQEKNDESSLIKIELENSKKEEQTFKKKYEELEKGLKELLELKNQMKLLVQKKESNQKMIQNLEQEEKSVDKELLEIKVDDVIKEKISLDEINNKILEIKNKIKDADEKILDVKNRLAILDSKKSESLKLASEINHLEKCPTCKQDVRAEHKKIVEQKEKEKLKEYEEKTSKYSEFFEKAEKVKENLNAQLDKLNEDKTQAEILQQKKKLIDQQKIRIKNLKERKSLIKENISKIKLLDETEKENALKESIKLIDVDENKIINSKKDFEEKRIITKKLEIKNAELQQVINHKKQDVNRIAGEIKVKEEKKKELEKKKVTENWLTKQFVNVVDVVEKQVLGSIHQEFNQRFQEWFNILIDDETMNSSLDNSFTPIIVQNGFETEIANLSGGEKTSVALSYRLALNKVINDFMTTIKTRDLIILDEPTDGFSTEQLDKVRDVLDQLNSKQTIIVSHEPKVESFVENVIRIRKSDHVSEII